MVKRVKLVQIRSNDNLNTMVKRQTDFRSKMAHFHAQKAKRIRFGLLCIPKDNNMQKVLCICDFGSRLWRSRVLSALWQLECWAVWVSLLELLRAGPTSRGVIKTPSVMDLHLTVHYKLYLWLFVHTSGSHTFIHLIWSIYLL